MREALLKKRYGIPAALLVVLLLSGTALAWYGVNSISTKTKVLEPLSTKGETEFSDNMDPGDTNTWSFDIVNSADNWYDVKADLTFSAPDRVSITSFKVSDKDGNLWSDETSDLKDDGSAEFSVQANKTMVCTMKITAAKDATPGDVTVQLKLYRG